MKPVVNLYLGLIKIFTGVCGRHLLALMVFGAGATALVWAPPLQNVEPGTIGVRVNRLTGDLAVIPEGPALVLPLLHHLRRYPLRDQIYRPARSVSIEGLSLGMDVTVRYALDPERVTALARRLPENLGRDLIEPAVDGVLHRALARHTVHEIFCERRIEIEDEVQVELARLLNHHGVLVRNLTLVHVDPPGRYAPARRNTTLAAR
ncbi:MAG TPA: SPFH domain-containing protein [Polyangia bacterium]|jgi:regulator of protease activity HflC (stomatin/prohibitin superfamily)|nr:SPFH domain-containing protein [Polyangia bacterium]